MKESKENNTTRRTKILLICCVMALSAVMAFWTLGRRPLNNHECFVSVTAREMLESGEYVLPTFNSEPRLQKTPLSYWLVGLCAKITGKVDEFTTRLPSALFGVLSAGAVLYFVNRWLSFRIAIISALVWATSLGYIRYAHNARPEMAVTFFVTLCFLAFYSAVTARTRKRQITYILIFWASLSLGNLAKGPAPLPLVLVPLFFYVAVFREWKKLPKLLPIIGPIIFLAVVLPWPLAIAHRMNWDLTVWRREFLDRFFGQYASGDKPVYYYLPKMFQFMAPWVAFVPMALAAPFYRVWDRKQPVMQFLWLWFVVDVVFLTIMGGKRQHYIIPAMPAMAILTGILFEDMAFGNAAYTKKSVKSFLLNHVVILTIVFVGLPVVITQWKPELLFEALVLSTIGLISVLLIAGLFRAQEPSLACGVLFASVGILVMSCYSSFINPLNYNQPSRRFTKAVAQRVSDTENLVAYKSASARFIHYFGRAVPKIADKTEIWERYERGCWIVAAGRYLDELVEDGRYEIAYLQQNAERHKQYIVGGALLHKSSVSSKNEM